MFKKIPFFGFPGFRHSSSVSRDNLLRDWPAEDRECQPLDTGQPEGSREGSRGSREDSREGSRGSREDSREGSRGSREGSRGSLEGFSGSKECPPPSPDRDGLVSPDIIRTVASTIQPSPRRRITNPGVQCWVSIIFRCRSGSSDPHPWLMDPDPAPFFSDFKDVKK